MLRLAVALALLVPSGAVASSPEPIGDGFVAVEGTRLVGRAVPLGKVVSNEDVDLGWRAVLELDGDPRGVVDAFIEQAEAMGLRVDPVPASVLGGRAPGYARCAMTTATVHQCRATARSRSGKQPRSLQVETVRGSYFGEAVSSVEVTYSTSSLYWRYASSWVYGVRVRNPPGPKSAYDPPAPGEAFGGGWPQIAGLVVEEGSTVAGRPLPALSCSNDGSVVVLRVDGVASKVFDAYEAQAVQLLRESGSFRSSVAVPGGRLQTFSVSQAGGESIAGRLFDAEDGEPVLRIDTCVD